MNFRPFLFAMFASLHIQRIQNIAPMFDTSFGEDCLKPVLVDSEAQNVYLICDLNSTLCSPNIIRNVSDVAWMHFDSSIQYETELNFYKPFFCVIASDSVETMYYFLNEFGTFKSGKIILIYPTDASPTAEEMKKLIKATWEEGITDLVIIQSNSSDCHVSSFVPFFPGGCYDAFPVLLNTWKRNLALEPIRKINYFPHNAISNLYMCNVPFVHRDVSILETWLPLLESLGKAMNSTYYTVHIGERVPSYIPQYNLFINYELIEAHLTSSETTILPSYFTTTEIVLAVPCRHPVSCDGWFLPLDEFSDTVWFAIILSFLVSIVIIYLHSNGERSLVSTVLFSLRPLLGTRSPSLPRHGRGYLGSWLFLCLVLTGCYRGILRSKLRNPCFMTGMVQYHDFIRSNMLIVTPKNTELFVLEYVSSSPYYSRLEPRISYVNSSLEDILNMNRNDVGHFVVAEDFYTMFKNRSYCIFPGETFTRVSSTMMSIPSPSVLGRAFKLAFLRVVEAGILDYIRLRNLRDRDTFRRLQRSDHMPYKRTGPMRLSLSYLGGVFVVLAGGCVVACIVFVFEVCFRAACRSS